jgi:nucleoside phosphorylase
LGQDFAAATTQYVIDKFHPDLLVNLGTCGGFEGRIARGTIIMVTKTIIYDIIEQMSDPEEAIEHFSTDLQFPLSALLYFLQIAISCRRIFPVWSENMGQLRQIGSQVQLPGWQNAIMSGASSCGVSQTWSAKEEEKRMTISDYSMKTQFSSCSD